MFLKILFKVISVLLMAINMFSGCSGSSPFIPDRAGVLEIIHLREGYVAEYECSYDTYEYYPRGYKDGDEYTYKFNGVFRIEVDKEITRHWKKYFNLRVTFHLEDFFYHFRFFEPGVGTISGMRSAADTTITTEFKVLYKNGSLWYVENAPSFEKLEEGELSLFLEGPVVLGSALNVRLFELPGKRVPLYSNNYSLKSNNEQELIYTNEGQIGSSYTTIIAVLEKGTGFKSLTYSGGQRHISFEKIANE